MKATEPRHPMLSESNAGPPAAPDATELDCSIEQNPDFAIAHVRLKPGQKLLAERSAMVTMAPGVLMKAGLTGGWRRSLGRLLGGENLIVNTFSSEQPAAVSLAPASAGDICKHSMRGGSLLLQRGAFLAHTEGIQITGKWQGARGFFSGEGLVLLRASGEGQLLFNSYGAILELDVREGFVVDTGYVVAFEDTLSYSVTALPGLRPSAAVKTLLFGGEGLVCRFSGQGRLWVQTRHVLPFLRWVHAYRPAGRG